MKRSIPIFALMLVGLAATESRADLTDLTVTLGNATVTSGGTGTLDIYLTTNGSNTLADYGVELLITPVSGATSFLQFSQTQANPTGNLNYVFYSQSFAADYSQPVFSTPYGTNYPSDTIIFGDQDDSTQGYVALPTMNGAANSYLATVAFQSANGATAGDQFQVTLVNDPGQTYFDDGGNPSTALSYTTTGGLITVTAAVPEPTSLAMLALSSLGGLLWQRHRRGRSLIA